MKQKKINKEAFMKFVSKMYDVGAKVNIHVYSDLLTEEEAKQTAKEFTQIVTGELKETITENMRWYYVDARHGLSVFHQNSRDIQSKRIEKLEKELAELKKAEEETA